MFTTYIWHLCYYVELSDLLILGFSFCFTIYDYGIFCSLVYWLVPALHFYMYLCSWMHVFRFRFIDIHVFTWFQIYCRSFNFLYVTCLCLFLHAWTKSPDHAQVWLPEHANWLCHMYSPGCFLTILDPHVQILESDRSGITVVDQSGAAEAWISGYLFGPSFFRPPLDRLARFSSCYSWVLSRISYCTSCFCAS